VQVAQGGVVDAVEHRGADRRHTAGGDVAFTVTWFSTGDEGMGEDDRPGPGTGGEVGAYPVHRRGEDGLVGGLVRIEMVLDQARFEVGKSVERHRTALVVQDGRAGAVVHCGAEMDSGAFDQAGVDSEPARGVVVAADHHQRHAHASEFLQDLIEQCDRVERRNGTVEHVARHCHRIDVMFPDGVQEESEKVVLLVDKRHTVKLTAQASRMCAESSCAHTVTTKANTAGAFHDE
jgi:hypothetical protein